MISFSLLVSINQVPSRRVAMAGLGELILNQSLKQVEPERSTARLPQGLLFHLE